MPNRVRSQVSTVPLSGGQPNPYYRNVETLVKQKGDFLSIANSILAKKGAIGKGELTLQQRRALLDNLQAEKQRFFELMGKVIEPQPVEKVMPPAPSPDHLYGRFSKGSKVLDIGTGNGTKVRRYATNLDLVVSDPNISGTYSVPKKNVIKKPYEDLGDEVKKGRVFTSFNVLVQMENWQDVLLHDGIHVIPDHGALLQRGYANLIDGRVHCLGLAGAFVDHLVEHVGVNIDTYYRVVVGLAQRECNVRFKHDFDSWENWPNDDNRAKIQGEPCVAENFNSLDLSYKWDGIALELEVQNGTCYLSTRSGRSTVSVEVVDLPDMVLHLEYVGKGSTSAFILLRVLVYRGFLFPHSGETLRFFASKVKIRLDGKEILAPPKYDPIIGPQIDGIEYPQDGLISRFEEKDFYVKKEWTLDVLAEELPALRDGLEREGLELELVGDPPDRGLSEFIVRRRDCVIILDFQRLRKDKYPSGRALDNLLYLLTLPTIDELVALYGRLPSFEGVRAGFC